MEDWQSRTALLLGQERLERLKAAHVLVVGVGGVGAYAVEMLCRAGVGRFTLVDADVVNPTNINRQLIALHSTVGSAKTDLLKQRMQDISPQVEVDILSQFIRMEDVPSLLDRAAYDFVVDAIDSLLPKCCLIKESLDRSLKIVSSMGAGAKTDPTQIKLVRLKDTFHCGLAKSVRSKLKEMKVDLSQVPVVFSAEPPNREAIVISGEEFYKTFTVGTVSYLPAIFGCFLAGYVIQHL